MAGLVIFATVVIFTVLSLTIGGPAVLLILATLLAMILSVKSPDIGFVFATVVGVGNGAIRRVAGWLDPSGVATQIVPVLPAVVLVFLYITYFVLGRRSGADANAPKPFMLIAVVVVLAGVLPAGAGLLNNMLASALLLAGMLAFLLTYHRVISRGSVIRVIAWLGSLNAAYMIAQEINGLTPWDAYWVDRFGYSALYLGPNVVRPLGFGASAAESAAMCAVLVGVAVARLRVTRNPIWFVPVSLGLYAVLTSGTRTFALPALAAILLGLAIGRRRPLLVGLIAVGITLPLVVVFAARLLPAVSSPGAARVLTMLSGEENEQTSTVGIHQDLILTSLLRGLSSIIGTGSGQVSILASAGLGSSEQDISNMALMGGVLGVIAMLTIYISFVRRVPAAFTDEQVAPFLFIAIATAGQWMNVGYYGVTPLVWAALGVVFTVRKRRYEVDSDWERRAWGKDGWSEQVRRGLRARSQSGR
ncbi:hypothetical protein Q9R20_12085 [Microbacterium sp. PRF11]|uniref:hypothetical protein n=1 Tax=Microbacterium sp. PRF11 TaxID=2962593 RepID=UPI0028811FF0|nr:hypothetical protein [Microbacterium sp. PRF11]MDT0117729.1 hypothetical protein [Microbacterium sp. PRF11]